MKELDYQPNMTARSLATGQSFIVGLIVPDLLNPFFTEFAKFLGEALRQGVLWPHSGIVREQPRN